MKNLKGMVRECAVTVRALDMTGYPENELGYFRMYYSDGVWYGRVFPIHKELNTDALIKEFDEVIAAFRKEFKDMSDMRKFVREKGYTRYDRGNFSRWIFHLITDLAIYRFDVRDTPGDYNVYLHCYVKEG